jgi:hypothetical protein
MSEEVVDPEKRADQLEKEMIELREAYARDFGGRRPASPKGEQPWKSKCCGPDGTEISKSFLVFSLTSVLSITILIFALWQLAENEPTDPLNPLWISLVSSVSALHVPSPLQQTDSKK